MSTRLRVLFVHGLESNPQGSKARYLAKHFDASCPAMNTADPEGCVRVQADAVARFSPDVLVGSSFGGAIALLLLDRALYRGPTVLLCPAAGVFGAPRTLPRGAVVTVVHGREDEVIPLASSRALVAGHDPSRVQLVEVSDGHRLLTLIDHDTLRVLVQDTHRRAGNPS